uniref:Uncharacterized protein n=1 Tax=Solanum lycopersicum TaxID=4081 RepID=K4AV19_SOLLC
MAGSRYWVIIVDQDDGIHRWTSRSKWFYRNKCLAMVFVVKMRQFPVQDGYCWVSTIMGFLVLVSCIYRHCQGSEYFLSWRGCVLSVCIEMLMFFGDPTDEISMVMTILDKSSTLTVPFFLCFAVVGSFKIREVFFSWSNLVCLSEVDIFMQCRTHLFHPTALYKEPFLLGMGRAGTSSSFLPPNVLFDSEVRPKGFLRHPRTSWLGCTNSFMVLPEVMMVKEARKYFFSKYGLNGSSIQEEALDEASRNFPDARTGKDQDSMCVAMIPVQKSLYQGLCYSLFVQVLCCSRFGESTFLILSILLVVEVSIELWSLKMQLLHGMECMLNCKIELIL